MNADKLRYGISGLFGLISRKKACPSCDSLDFEVLSRKGFHTFSRCLQCDLRSRHPLEDGNQMTSLYQTSYNESGMTTNLPNDKELLKLVKNNFRGSEKDCTSIIDFLRAIGIGAGSSILDFGANWGYLSLQLSNAGYDVKAYEISKSRAEFGKKIGVEIETDINNISQTFDCVFSSHVLEHVPNPRQSIEDQISLTRPNGLVVGITPNGSSAWLDADPQAYNASWGRVHPVLLTDVFVRNVAGYRPYYIGSGLELPAEISWDKESQVLADSTGPFLYFAIRC